MQAQGANQFVVVIDAGHGGGDVGTPHRKCKQDEKTIALNVALKLGKMIERKHPDVKVVYTRTTDVYPTLPDRTRIARESKGHLFISIHVNAALDSKAKGFETYVFGVTGLQGKSADEQKRIRERTMAERENLDIDGKQIDFENAVDIETKILCQAQREKHNKYSQEIAHYVQDILMADLRRSEYCNNAQDRGVKQKNIFVLCYSPMPAILVELGYMSNVSEEKFINKPESQDLFANAIYKGFEQYKNNWDRRQLREEETSETPAIASAITTQEAAPEAQAKAIEQENAKRAIARQEEIRREEERQAAARQAAAQEEAVRRNMAAAKQQDTSVKTTAANTTSEAKQHNPADDPDGTPTPPVPAKACYRIQILSSIKQFKKGDPALKGIWPVYSYEVNGYYRYTYGEGVERSDLSEDISKIRQSFPDAFIVRFDANGKRL